MSEFRETNCCPMALNSKYQPTPPDRGDSRSDFNDDSTLISIYNSSQRQIQVTMYAVPSGGTRQLVGSALVVGSNSNNTGDKSLAYFYNADGSNPYPGKFVLKPYLANSPLNFNICCVGGAGAFEGTMGSFSFDWVDVNDKNVSGTVSRSIGGQRLTHIYTIADQGDRVTSYYQGSTGCNDQCQDRCPGC